MFKNIDELPEAIKTHIPDKEMQKIYLETYNKSWEDYEEYRGGDAGRESVAHRDAMHAVKKDHTYDKETAKWYIKGEEPQEGEEEEDQGLMDQVKDNIPGI